MELTNIQKKAVEEIYSFFSLSSKTRVDFKSPTGSGKTLMATWLISSIIERNPDDKFIFIIATPSSSKLPFFFEQKIIKYKSDLPYSKFQVEYIESPSSTKSADVVEKTPKIKVEKNKVYIFGKATFGSKRIFTEQHVIDDFVDDALNQGYKIIYIRDEAHIGDAIRVDNETRQFESLMLANSHFVLKMTATPNLSDPNVHIVTIKESDLNNPLLNENKWLLKTEAKVLLQSSMDEEQLLDNAIVEFKKIKDDYKTLESNGVVIHPAMLIQVSNEPSDKEKKKEFLANIDLIKERLNFHGLSWVQYFGDADKDSNRVYGDNFSLDDITKIDNEIDAVIFKVGPSTGWDIPRACMLLQLRKVCSEKLNVQTIGRIKRNPFPGLLKNDITSNYYIYSNSPQIDDDISYFNFKVKEPLKDNEFPSIQISNKKDFKLAAKKEQIKNDVCKFLNDNKSEIIQDLKTVFVFKDGEHIFRNELYEANGSIVYSSVTSPFVFLKMLYRLIDSKNNVFQACKEGIEKGYKDIFSSEKIYDGLTIQLEHLQFIVLHKYTNNLMSIIKKNSPFESQYEIVMMPYEPKQFLEVYETIEKEGIIDSSDSSYFFDVKKNNAEDFIQPLDSGSELIVFNKLKQVIYGINNFADSKVLVWCKNYTSSNVNGDYLDENHSFHKSYFDYIIKFENGAFLYVEVKNKKDIDEDKTKLLKDSYKSYFESSSSNFFNVPVVISVWTVENTMVYTDSFYNKSLFDGLDITSLSPEEIVKKIASHKFGA